MKILTFDMATPVNRLSQTDKVETYPTRAPTTFACAAYRVGADSVFRNRREIVKAVLGEMVLVPRIRGAKLREAILEIGSALPIG